MQTRVSTRYIYMYALDRLPCECNVNYEREREKGRGRGREGGREREGKSKAEEGLAVQTTFTLDAGITKRQHISTEHPNAGIIIWV